MPATQTRPFFIGKELYHCLLSKNRNVAKKRSRNMIPCFVYEELYENLNIEYKYRLSLI
jgi:hypothetical protein